MESLGRQLVNRRSDQHTHTHVHLHSHQITALMPDLTHHMSFSCNRERGKKGTMCVGLCRVCVVSCWHVHMSADMISISLLVPLLSLSGSIKITRVPNFPDPQSHIRPYTHSFTNGCSLCARMIKSALALTHLCRSLQPHVFQVGVDRSTQPAFTLD